LVFGFFARKQSTEGNKKGSRGWVLLEGVDNKKTSGKKAKRGTDKTMKKRLEYRDKRKF